MDIENPVQTNPHFMKKIIITSFFLGLFLIVKAQHNGSVLNLSMYNNAQFTVQLDDEYFHNPDHFYTIKNIIPGNHYLRVFQQRHHLRREVFSGFINISPASVISAKVERNNRLFIHAITPVFTQPVSIPYSEYPVQIVCENDFREMLNVISNRPFDSSRLSLSMQMASSNHFTSAQIARILHLFSFDSSRLEFAKHAYRFAADKQNYYRTYDSFSFDSSVRELSDFISHV
jgi:hypothetical protein